MPVTALIGLQWGDEGKGKVVDALAASVDLIIRAQGGANAGHTVIVSGERRVLHLIPSGMLYPSVTGVIGNGVVVDPMQLVKEIDGIEASGHDLSGRMWLSDRAHLVLPYHRVWDAFQERLRGGGALGTTGRGIGPAYQDKAARSGIRAGELRDETVFKRRVEEELERKRHIFGDEENALLDREMVMDDLLAARERLAPIVRDTVAMAHDALDRDANVLIEGAQGTLLDLDLGTYPFVTSSNCHVGGLLAGSGLPPSCVSKVIGVAKSYCTRVGAGPFPTEVENEVGEAIRERGREFGATTGRPRRCGWFDAVAGRFAVRANGVTEIALTKTDVLSGQATVSVCTHYDVDGEECRTFPAGGTLDRVQPRYTEFAGFDEDLSTVDSFEVLPQPAKDLVEFIEESVGCRVSLVSTGPDRDQTITR